MTVGTNHGQGLERAEVLWFRGLSPTARVRENAASFPVRRDAEEGPARVCTLMRQRKKGPGQRPVPGDLVYIRCVLAPRVAGRTRVWGKKLKLAGVGQLGWKLKTAGLKIQTSLWLPPEKL